MYAGVHLYKTGKMSQIKDMIFSMPDRLRANFYYHTNDDDKLYMNIQEGKVNLIIILGLILLKTMFQ